MHSTRVLAGMDRSHLSLLIFVVGGSDCLPLVVRSNVLVDLINGQGLVEVIGSTEPKPGCVGVVVIGNEDIVNPEVLVLFLQNQVFFVIRIQQLTSLILLIAFLTSRLFPLFRAFGNVLSLQVLHLDLFYFAVEIGVVHSLPGNQL